VWQTIDFKAAVRNALVALTSRTELDSSRMRRPPLPNTADRHWAWFLDVDGTLLELEADPELVRADERLLELLDLLSSNYGGAVALISGRSLDQLDRIFGHYKPAARSEEHTSELQS